MRTFFFIIISNVFHKLDLKKENSPPYFRSDYQMMMDNRESLKETQALVYNSSCNYQTLLNYY